MPTLNWIGKEAVINHHHDVKFRTLTKKYTFSSISNEQLAMSNSEKTQPIANCKLLTANSENKIIHGDNLEALKALLPEYEGRIKCIYIDPPYNTGNEKWIYNDNVNSPKIQKWLHDVYHDSGVTVDDLTRHDKWLCMMYPRLKLLQKLLADDGAIFISIDDNEQANLKLICDEIFGAGNFVAECVRKRRDSQANLSKNISPIHEYLFIYRKSISCTLNKIPAKINLKDYKNPDNDSRGPYVTMPCTNKGGSKYTVITPSGKEITEEWRFKEDTYYSLLSDNRLIFPKGGDGKPRYKLFLYEKQKEGVLPNTWLDEISSNQDATREIKSIMSKLVFDTPKPTELVEFCIKLSSDKDSIILDSFAGSGTTAHAVLNLNQQDGGHRKFILVEMEDYAETITAERVRRVMKGYGNSKNAVEGTGGSFTFYELGETVFDENGYLNESVGIQKIREYIWYSETRKPYVGLPQCDSPTTNETENGCHNVTAPRYLLGNHNGTAYYFYYEPDKITTLDKAFLNNITHRAEQYVIYADNCLLSDEFMQLNHIVFKKIPRDIKKL